jgi:hypothetical protein
MTWDFANVDLVDAYSNPDTALRAWLTSGYAPIVAPPCAWPHGPTALPGSARNNAASRGYALSYAMYEGAYVDLSGFDTLGIVDVHGGAAVAGRRSQISDRALDRAWSVPRAVSPPRPGWLIAPRPRKLRCRSWGRERGWKDRLPPATPSTSAAGPGATTRRHGNSLRWAQGRRREWKAGRLWRRRFLSLSDGPMWTPTLDVLENPGRKIARREVPGPRVADGGSAR